MTKCDIIKRQGRDALPTTPKNMDATTFEAKLAATYQSITETLNAWDEMEDGSFSIDEDPLTAEKVAYLKLIFQDLSKYGIVDELVESVMEGPQFEC